MKIGNLKGSNMFNKLKTRVIKHKKDIDNLTEGANEQEEEINNLTERVVVLEDAPDPGLDYLELVGILNQTGTNAPVLTILANTLGEVPTMARTGNGNYTLTTVADLFDNSKTVWSISNYDKATATVSYIEINSTKIIAIYQKITDPGISGVDTMVNVSLLIRIYP